MTKIKIRKLTFDSLFKNILSINFAETWNQYKTDDDAVNPLVIFETAKWNKLRNLLKEFIDNNQTNYFTDNTSKKDLEIGNLIGLYHLIDIKINHNEL
tara:strand:- start:499 stop:792 length:294 start_codon:yes stop_codon:yes gene_type:complete